jgi:hypothetical protein
MLRHLDMVHQASLLQDDEYELGQKQIHRSRLGKPVFGKRYHRSLPLGLQSDHPMMHPMQSNMTPPSTENSNYVAHEAIACITAYDCYDAERLI